MRKDEYLQVINNAPRLDSELFDLSSEDKIDRLEEILAEHSKEQGKTLIGVPLVQPYGGPTCEYVLLLETQYWELRKALKKNDWTVGCNEIGIPYDKKCFQIKRKNLKEDNDCSRESIRLLERIKRQAQKIKIYEDPSDYYL